MGDLRQPPPHVERSASGGPQTEDAYTSSSSSFFAVLSPAGTGGLGIVSAGGAALACESVAAAGAASAAADVLACGAGRSPENIALMRFDMSCTMAAASSSAGAAAMAGATSIAVANGGSCALTAGGAMAGGAMAGGALARGAVLGSAGSSKTCGVSFCLGLSTSACSATAAGVVLARAAGGFPAPSLLLAWYLRHTQ